MSSSNSSTTHTTISICTPSRMQDATMTALALSRALPRTAMALASSTLSRLSMSLLLLATLSYICTWGELDHQVLHAHSSHATVAAHDAQHCA